MIEQIFLSPPVKQSLIISNKLVYTNHITICQAIQNLEKKYQKHLESS